MGWSRPDEDYRADYERDLRKHDDGPAAPSISLSMECVIAVKAEPNYEKAARLIEDFARAEAAAERLDAVRAGAGR